MINIFDTLNSEKYRKVVEDREILMGRLKESPLKIIETKSP